MRSQFGWRSLCAVIAVLGLNGSASMATLDSAALKHEHAGELFSSVSSKCIDGVLTGGNSTGKYKEIDGVNLYLAYPPKKKPEVAILYLTDIFGVQLVNNRLLADSFALAGYLVVVPDLFEGDPVPADALSNPASGFNLTAWSAIHTPAKTDAIINSTINSIRSNLGVSKIGGAGYCFGGKYVARFLAPGKGLDAGFTAHPSSVVAAEWQGISKPLSIAFGALDASNTPAQRAAAEATFQGKNVTYQTTLYSNAEHGFAVRTDLSIPEKRFAQESAYFQAVRWFDAWLKTKK
ncbi:dienelactone hydrolase [Phlyctema vagabunda]|uniref:Dienelactone hydrolase n=1 Tax=Phlyctema vagabunda TaxID=108571 RepID=A0ABR4PU19_9HELO